MPKPYLCALPIHLALFAALLCTMPVNIFGAPKFNRLASFNPNSLRKCPCGRDVLDYMDDYYLNSNYKRSTNSFDGGTQGSVSGGQILEWSCANNRVISLCFFKIIIFTKRVPLFAT